MKKHNMHITVVLDRSGSMQSIRDDIIGGMNAFMEQQRAGSDGTTVTLVQFDTEDPFETVYSFLPVGQVPELTEKTFCPRGGTPLLDATARTIVNLETWLAVQPKDQRPNKMVIVVVTDGQENSSREFSLAQVKQLIAEKQEKEQWQFVYLSADLGAVDDAIKAGFSRDAVMAFDKDTRGTRAMFHSVSEQVLKYSCKAAPRVEFSPEDREKQRSEKARA